jgi:hypothetical protein
MKQNPGHRITNLRHRAEVYLLELNVTKQIFGFAIGFASNQPNGLRPAAGCIRAKFG